MTKQDYELIARAIKGVYEQHDRPEAVAELATFLASEFAARNPQFKRAKFLTACGMLLLA